MFHPVNFNFIAMFVFGIAASGGPLSGMAAADPEPETEIWTKVRESLFGARPMKADSGEVIQLEAPYRVEDAATVPVALRTRLEQRPERFIEKIYLFIDKNPSPVAAVFTFTLESGRAEIETRVRIEEYSHIRAVAEMNTGELFIVSRFIKAAGGCSAPAGKDAQAALARLGKMRFSADESLVEGLPALAQLMISHPNFSGLAMDQATRLYTPAHFVRSVNITYGGKLILNADVDFSISENPNFRFYFVPRGEGELHAEVVDNKDLRFETALAIGHAVTLRQ